MNADLKWVMSILGTVIIVVCLFIVIDSDTIRLNKTEWRCVQSVEGSAKCSVYERVLSRTSQLTYQRG